MAHIVRNESWGVVDLDTLRGTVFIRQDWHYTWHVEAPMAPWSHEEQRAFHHAVDHMIWARWSRQMKIRVIRDSLASPSQIDYQLGRFARGLLSLTFDVRSVRGPGHWDVAVFKIGPQGSRNMDALGNPIPSNVTSGKIVLYSKDQTLRRAKRFPGDPWTRKTFSVPAHEFGHTIGNKDEYARNNPNFEDAESIMNIGRHLRPRHLHQICASLAEMAPGYSFSPFVLSDR